MNPVCILFHKHAKKRTWPISSHLDGTSLVNNPGHIFLSGVLRGDESFSLSLSLSELTGLILQYLTETWETEAPLLWRIKRENWAGKEDAKGFWRTGTSKTSHGMWSSTILSRWSALTRIWSQFASMLKFQEQKWSRWVNSCSIFQLMLKHLFKVLLFNLCYLQYKTQIESE